MSSSMTDSERSKCHAIIHSAAVAAGAVGAGLAQIPLSDNLVIMPIQIGMVASLGKVFGKTLGESTITSLISAAAGTVVGRSASQALLGWIPVLGNAINASTAFSITEAIGWAIANNFAIEKRNEEKEAERRWLEEEERRWLEEEASKGIFKRVSAYISACLRSIGFKMIKAAKFVCSLPVAALLGLVDILRSMLAFLKLLVGVFVRPFVAIPLILRRIWVGLVSLCKMALEAIRTIAPVLVGARIVLYITVKFNIFPGLQHILTTLFEIIDLVL